MSYAKLNTNDVEAAPIPSLYELQAECELGKVPVEGVAPAPVASKTIEPQATTATATAVVISVPTQQQEPPRGWSVNSCCCGCSLATGIRIMSYLDFIHALTLFFTAITAIWFKINEHRVDSMIEDNYEKDAEANAEADAAAAADVDASSSADADVYDENEEANLIASINTLIDVQAFLVPVYLLLGMLIMYYAYKGLHSACGDVAATTSYLRYRRAVVLFSAITAIFSSGLVGAACQVMLAYYFMVVVRSHLANLTANSTDAATASIVVVNA